MQHRWTPEETARFIAEGNRLARRDGIRCRGCEHCAPLCAEACERGKREATAEIVTWLRGIGEDAADEYAQFIERGEHIAKAVDALKGRARCVCCSGDVCITLADPETEPVIRRPQ